MTDDVTHHPVQFIAPDWRMFLDGDPETAAHTRKDFMSRYANSGARIFGAHFPDTSSGFLEIVDGTAQFVPEPSGKA